MRLINTKTLRLEEHNDFQLPPYAILTHRWDAPQHEVTFQDLTLGREVRHKRGFVKLKNFCCVSLSLRYAYAWLDTCCINKESTTELKTALNSMYRWYEEAGVCIGYLEDIRSNRIPLERSAWFTRGWTLQELIAPKDLIFYDRHWLKIGKKSELLQRLSAQTGIPIRVLGHRDRPHDYSIAQRMSWAAGRTTERIEDRAYSLLGLFNVVLEMEYGVREKAFALLQEKIIETSPDQFIFNWSLDTQTHPLRHAGVLAPSPDLFAGCGDVYVTRGLKAFAMMNIGCSITLQTEPYAISTHIAYLDCASYKEDPDARLGILVSRLAGTDRWTRIMDQEGKSVLRRKVPTTRTVERPMYLVASPESPLYYRQLYGFRFRNLDPLSKIGKVQIHSKNATTSKHRVFIEHGSTGTAGVVCVRASRSNEMFWHEIRLIKVGIYESFEPVIMIANKVGRKTESLSIDAARLGHESAAIRSAR